MKILRLFKMSPEDKTEKRAVKLAETLGRRQLDLIGALDTKKDTIQDKIDALLEQDVKKINVDTFNQDYHELTLDLLTVEKEIEIAQGNYDKLYRDEAEN